MSVNTDLDTSRVVGLAGAVTNHPGQRLVLVTAIASLADIPAVENMSRLIRRDDIADTHVGDDTKLATLRESNLSAFVVLHGGEDSLSNVVGQLGGQGHGLGDNLAAAADVEGIGDDSGRGVVLYRGGAALGDVELEGSACVADAERFDGSSGVAGAEEFVVDGGVVGGEFESEGF